MCLLKIVFVCTGNTCRSPIAEFLTKSIFMQQDLHANISSAGTMVIEEEPMSSGAITALTNLHLLGSELEREMSRHRSRLVNLDMVYDSDFVFAMAYEHKSFLLNKFPDQRDRIFILGDFVSGTRYDVMDPFGKNVDIYRNCALEIYKLLILMVKRITNIECVRGGF